MTAADKIAEALPKAEKLARAMENVMSGGRSFNRQLAAQVRNELRASQARADAQAQEIARLQGALGFYANPENWKGDEEAWERAENGDDDPETLEAMLSTVEIDGGKIARATLGDAP